MTATWRPVATPEPSRLPTGSGSWTGGVRCQRFLKGEDMLVMAWAGPAPAVAATESGAPVQLPDPVGKRDGSGVAPSRQVAVIGGSVRVR